MGRYLRADEINGVPWFQDDLFTGGPAFNPALYDAVETAPCCTWQDDKGGQATERADDTDGAPITMWSVYLHLKTGGAECVADLPSEEQMDATADRLRALYGYQ